jgi:hypothetical protein
MSRRCLTLLFSIAFFLVALGIVSLSSSNSSNEPQKIQTLKIFLDKDLLTLYVGQSLWTDVYAGANNRTIWLKNTGPISMEGLSFISPPLPANITLTWDCENYTLKPYETKQATLTLTVPSSCNLKSICIKGAFYIVSTKVI